MNSHPRDVLLTLLSVAIGTKQVQFDHYWFKCDGPVDKDAITRGVRLFCKDKQENEGKTIDREAITIYNVFVAEQP